MSPAAHIALNAHLLAGRASYRSAGIHQYISRLLTHLPSADPAFRYTVFTGAGRPDMPEAVIRRSRWPTERPLVRILWEQLALPLELARLRPDLLHALAFVAPLAGTVPAVVTVYDLSFRLTPNRFPAAQRLYLSAFTAHTCRRARRVIAISESTRADIIRLLGVSPERVDVAYPGVLPEFRPLPAAEVEVFRRRRGLPERFLLYLGTLEPRKNLDTLIQAYARLRSQHPGLKLVLAGAKGWAYAPLFRRVEDLGLGREVLFPGFVPEAELALWYNTAAAFVYPSSYEGFGLPVAEALACGRPVVTSNVSSLPEAGGSAALLAPPGQPEALAQALEAALSMPPEQAAAGPAHAARFSWGAAAAQTAATYRRALRLDPAPAGSDRGAPAALHHV